MALTPLEGRISMSSYMKQGCRCRENRIGNDQLTIEESGGGTSLKRKGSKTTSKLGERWKNKYGWNPVINQSCSPGIRVLDNEGKNLVREVGENGRVC